MNASFDKAIIVLLITLSLSLLIFSCDGKTRYPVSSGELDRFMDCEEDSDCIFVNNGCCDCANGGIEVAINKNMLPDFLNLFDCSDVMCTEMAREPACGSGTISCSENGKCSYVLSSASKLYLKE